MVQAWGGALHSERRRSISIKTNADFMVGLFFPREMGLLISCFMGTTHGVEPVWPWRRGYEHVQPNTV